MRKIELEIIIKLFRIIAIVNLCFCLIQDHIMFLLIYPDCYIFLLVVFARQYESDFYKNLRMRFHQI